METRNVSVVCKCDEVETIHDLMGKIEAGVKRLQALLDGRDPDEEVLEELVDQGFKYGEPNDEEYGD